MTAENTARLARRLSIIFLWPILLLLLVGALLGLLISEMNQETRASDHSGTVIAKAFEVEKRIVDQETGLRGYLLTDDAEFLDPYQRANPTAAIAELGLLVADDPEQLRRTRLLSQRYQAWLGSVDRAVTTHHPGIGTDLPSLRLRKRQMDEIRAVLTDFLSSEQTFRGAQLQRARTTTTGVTWAFVGLLALTAFLISYVSRRQVRAISDEYAAALAGERKAREGLEAEDWIRSTLLELTRGIQGELSIDELSTRILRVLALRTQAEVGVLYAAEDTSFQRRAVYSLDAGTVPEGFVKGQGLLGQVVTSGERKWLKDLPPSYLRIESATVKEGVAQAVILPTIVEDTVHAVIELGFLSAAEPRAMELLDRAGSVIAVAVRSAEYRSRLRELLVRTQDQAARLQSQQEELRVQNEELEEQSQALQQAQRDLEAQHLELEQANGYLKDQTEQLELSNERLTRAHADLAQRSREIAEANQYKSDFLANMSHELRTPLNSSLILAKVLADNKEGNLTAEQVRFAETIYSAGNDLLALINDVLDLSKIEAGKVELHPERVSIRWQLEQLERTFDPLARDRGLTFNLSSSDDVQEIETDGQRLQQILNNLLSNAVKFTERGSVEFRVSSFERDRVRFDVRDTGIGIAPEKRQVIFEAFQQEDGTTSRRYGGTGLGLAISRDLAHLLGGDILLESEVGRGSTFSLILPRVFAGPTSNVGRAPRATARILPPVKEFVGPTPASAAPLASMPKTTDAPALSTSQWVDDRSSVDPSRRLILVVEDDANFARILLDLAHEREFQCVVAENGEQGLRFASELAPNAIILDVNLPDCSGLSLLDRLKQNRATRHIPVHMMSVSDHSQAAMEMGAVGYLLKPATSDQVKAALGRLEATLTRGVRRVLVVEDDAAQRESICLLLGDERVTTVSVGTVAEALELLRTSTFDCVVMDLSLPDASGYEMLDTMAKDESCSFPPVVVYTGRSLSAEEEQQLRRFSDSIIVKGARSPERLLDEVTLFLHRVEAELPAERQRMLKQARDREAAFEGRRILIVEDDVRNIFALSTILEPKGALIEIARNGREALAVLERKPGIDLVLMDVMMPEMDGLEATREIRKRPEWAKLPIIALTAKAMQDDREHCLEAGANDYASKPLDVEMLLSLIRVWMPR